MREPANSEPAEREPAEREPGSLTVELGEGFSDDEVIVLLDGQQVWHRKEVTTNYSVGLAGTARLPWPPPSGSATVEVRVRGRARSHRVTASPGAGEVRVRVDLTPDGVLSLGPAPEGWVY